MKNIFEFMIMYAEVILPQVWVVIFPNSSLAELFNAQFPKHGWAVAISGVPAKAGEDAPPIDAREFNTAPHHHNNLEVASD